MVLCLMRSLRLSLSACRPAFLSSVVIQNERCRRRRSWWIGLLVRGYWQAATASAVRSVVWFSLLPVRKINSGNCVYNVGDLHFRNISDRNMPADDRKKRRISRIKLSPVGKGSTFGEANIYNWQSVPCITVRVPTFLSKR